MAGKARRARRAPRPLAPQLERLEFRTLLSGGSPSGTASNPPDPARSLLVGFKAGTSTMAAQAALRAVEGSIALDFPGGPSVVEFPSSGAMTAALGRLKANRLVAYAELDGMVQAADVIPNDPNFPAQWGLNSGNNVDIDAPQAWSISTGNSAIIVAVLDTGIDLRNPDLTSRLWTNPTANTDGYTGDVHGWNFVNNSPNIQDNNGHGSHVTGILGAVGNNGAGIAGVDWNAQIMPLKILGADGGGSTDAAVNAIMFAVNHGARVINASWGGNQYSQAMLQAISYANSRGVVFVTAAGNDGINNDAIPANYPADYRLPNELVVAAIDQSGNLAGFSDYGASTVDLAAPGVDIWSTVPGGFASYSGTSMATPFVTGVVSLLAGQNPGLGASALVQRVIATAKPLPSLAGKTVSGGMVDAYNALTGTASSQSATIASASVTLSFDQVENAVLSTDDVFQLYGNTSTGYVTQLYQTIFGRLPDPAGLAYYSGRIDQGVSRQDVIRELQGYDEAARTKVARWYQEELGWAAPLAVLKVNPGVMYWASMIDGGLSDDIVHARVLAAGVFPDQGAVGYAAGLYQTALARPADPTGLAYSAGQVEQGISRYDLALGLLTTDEGRRTQIARFYRDALGWNIDLATLKVDAGVEHWASLMGG